MGSFDVADQPHRLLDHRLQLVIGEEPIDGPNEPGPVGVVVVSEDDAVCAQQLEVAREISEDFPLVVACVDIDEIGLDSESAKDLRGGE